jgi:hypothetical protein
MTYEASSDQGSGQIVAQATKISLVSPEIIARISKLREIRQRLGEAAYREEWKRLSKDEAKRVLTALTLLNREAEPSAKIVQRSFRGPYNTWGKAFSIFIRFIIGVILASVVFGIVDFYLLTSLNIVGLFVAIVVEFVAVVGMIIWPIKMTLDAALAIHDGEAHLDSVKR